LDDSAKSLKGYLASLAYRHIRQHTKHTTPNRSVPAIVHDIVLRLFDPGSELRIAPDDFLLFASMKRKHTAPVVVGERPPKRPRGTADQSLAATTPAIEHPVLNRLYPEVASLRQYLLARLPLSSKIRRRKFAQVGLHRNDQNVTAIDVELGALLDSTLVGVLAKHVSGVENAEAVRERDRDLETFSQQLSPGTTGGTFKPGYFQQAEVSYILSTCWCYALNFYVVQFQVTLLNSDRLWTL
jgi:hypothetical protein